MQSQTQPQAEQESLSPRMRELIIGYRTAAAPRIEPHGLSEEMRNLIGQYFTERRRDGRSA
jgi:hypothetical protein